MESAASASTAAPADPKPALSIILPVWNESAPQTVPTGEAAPGQATGPLVTRLQALGPLRERGAEVLVVDGGSIDATAAQAAPWADRVLQAPRGRAAQMNAGAAAARAGVLLFLHADTRLPEGADALIQAALADNRPSPHLWGRFDVHIEGQPRMLRVVAAMMNTRSRLSGIATGDQAMFMRRDAFDRVGGFPDIALMEDIAMSRSLKTLGPPACLRQRVTTSGRRWERHGVWRTIGLMWRLRAAYWLGADPDQLAVRYGYAPKSR